LKTKKRERDKEKKERECVGLCDLERESEKE